MHSTKKTIQLNGLLKPKPKLTVLMMLLCKAQPQILQIITTELTLGPMHNMKKTIQPNGLLRPKLKLTVLMMLSCKDPLQLLLIITTESMLGLTHNTKKLTLLNGRPRLLKLPKVDTTLLPKD